MIDRQGVERIRRQRRRRYGRGIVMALAIGVVAWLFLLLTLAGFVVLLNAQVGG